MLNPVPRGEVTHKERAKQERDFTGLRYGNITPTDIDGLIEYRNQCYVFYEAKYITARPMSDGQKMAFERLCDDLQKVKQVLFIIFEHNTPTDKAIDFAKCSVHEYRYNGKWRKPAQELNVRKLSDKFIERFGNAS